MDAKALYNHFITGSTDNIVKCDIKWSLLGCEMALKDKTVDYLTHLRVLNYLLLLIKEEKDIITENNWIFIIDCTRKGIKRIHYSEVIKELLTFIIDNIQNIKAVEELLKLFLTCKDEGIELDDKVVNYLNSFYSSENVLSLDYDEFHFIDIKNSCHYKNQRRQRLLLLLDPLKGLQMFPNVNDDYWFGLFSISDSDLISFMKRLLKLDEKRFLKFYNNSITNDLLSVDFFIDKLLTDYVEILELLLNIFELKIQRKGKNFKNFHRLLLLKIELSMDFFPFDSKILLKKMEKFMKN